MSKQDRLQNCIFVKTILMFLVILGHSAAFWSEQWFTENPVYESALLKYLYEWLGSFHVYTFVLVSGYIFAEKMSGGGGVCQVYTVFEKQNSETSCSLCIYRGCVGCTDFATFFS